MDLEVRLQEMEDEQKLLKAEVKSVLTDLREAVLARTNPLIQDLGSTTVNYVSNVGVPEGSGDPASAKGKPERGWPKKDEPTEVPADEEDETPVAHYGQMEGDSAAAEKEPTYGADAPWRAAGEYPASVHRLASVAGYVDDGFVPWLSGSVGELGAQKVAEMLTIYRLLKPLPPNVGKALGHLQDLLYRNDELMPAWLRSLQELDRIASAS